MQDNSDNFLHPDRLLYSHQKALDETVVHGAIPRRLFRILYPIRVVDVHGRQRISTDMDEIQWFIERAIHQANLTSMDDLEFFFGLDTKYIRTTLSFLEKIGHVTVADGRLKLSKLGEESVTHRICYQERETQFKLYFDLFGNRPLRQEHYRVKLYETLPETTGFWIFPPYFRKWDVDALTRLNKREDKSHYGLMDEVSSISSAQEDRILYMPVYVVERAVDTEDATDLPAYLVFNSLPGYRDTELEQAINQDPILLDWLRGSSADLQDALIKSLDAFGIQTGDYQLEQDPVWGTEVILDVAAVSKQEGVPSIEVPGREIAIRRIGQYLLAAEWCVLLTCKDDAIRREAGIQNSLQWLEYSHSDPTAEETGDFISITNRRLDLHPNITVQVLLDEASRRGMNRATDRLERLY